MTQGNFFVTSLKDLSTWAFGQSIVTFSLDLGCCGCFLKPDMCLQNRGVQEVLNPRHADVLIISGAVTNKVSPVLRRLYDQMPDPKSVMAIGSCANAGGVFASSYAVVEKIQEIVPVDVFVTGCPPTVAAFQEGVAFLVSQRKGKVSHDRD